MPMTQSSLRLEAGGHMKVRFCAMHPCVSKHPNVINVAKKTSK